LAKPSTSPLENAARLAHKSVGAVVAIVVGGTRLTQTLDSLRDTSHFIVEVESAFLACGTGVTGIRIARHPECLALSIGIARTVRAFTTALAAAWIDTALQTRTKRHACLFDALAVLTHGCGFAAAAGLATDEVQTALAIRTNGLAAVLGRCWGIGVFLGSATHQGQGRDANEMKCGD